MNRPVQAAPRRASMPPGPSPTAGDAGRRIAAQEQELTDPDGMQYAQRQAVPPCPLSADDDDADPTRVISRQDLPPNVGRTPALRLPPVVVQPTARGARDPDDDPTRLIGSQSWPPSDMAIPGAAMPGPAMPMSDPPPMPTVVLNKNAPQKRAAPQPAIDNPLAGGFDQAPFVPPSDDIGGPEEPKGLAFRTVSTAPLRPGVAAPPPVVIVDSFHNETTAVTDRKNAMSLALGAAWTKHRDKLLLFGAGTLAGIVLFGMGFLLGNSGRSAPAAAPAVTAQQQPAIPAPPPPPPTATQAAAAPPPPPLPEPAPTVSAAAKTEPAAAALPPPTTGRSITSLALDTPTPGERRAKARSVSEPPRKAAAPAKTESAAAAPAAAPTATREPDPFASPASETKAPAAATARKGYVSPIQAPGF
jgi:hypothetical protein